MLRVIKSVVLFIFFFNSILFAATVNKKDNIDIDFSSDDGVILNQYKKTITAKGNVEALYDSTLYKAEEVIIWYQDLGKLNFSNLNRIEAINNVYIKHNLQVLKGNRYYFDKQQQVHVVEAKKGVPVEFKDDLHKLTAKDRMEYFLTPNVVVVRGNPVLEGKENKNSKQSYVFKSNIINAQLVNNENDDSSLDIDFIEGVGNVSFKSGYTLISSSYAIYYKKEGQIEFEGNVVLQTEEGSLKGCGAIYNLKEDLGKIIPCNPLKGFKGTYKPK